MNAKELEQELEKLHSASFAWAVACSGGDRMEAQDVLQAAYLKVLDGSAKYEARSSFKTWFFSVIRLTGKEIQRRKWRRAFLLDRWFGEQEKEDAPEREMAIARAETKNQLKEALAELSARQREVLELVFYHEMTIEEAATTMGVSLGTARVHYDRGKKELAKRIKNDSE